MDEWDDSVLAIWAASVVVGAGAVPEAAPETQAGFIFIESVAEAFIELVDCPAPLKMKRPENFRKIRLHDPLHTLLYLK